MTDVYVTADRHRAYESKSSGVSWSAIFAGAVAAWAMTIVLLAFGSAIGFSSVSPWPGSGVSASRFGLASGLYTVISAIIASALGGYITGRLRTSWVDLHDDEVYFRDTAHGLLSWALATVLGVLAFSASATVVGTGGLAGATTGASSTMTQSMMPMMVHRTADANTSTSTYVDTLLRPETSTTGTLSSPSSMNETTAPAESMQTGSTSGAMPSGAATGTMRMGNDQGARGEVTRIFTTSIRTGNDISSEDRAYIAQTISARSGVSQAEADRRITTTLNEARDAAEQARRTAVHLSLWLTAALLAGAFTASVAATEGGHLRDRDVPTV